MGWAQATQEVISRVPQTTAAEFNHAVENAQEAFLSWRNVALPQRQRVMFRLQELIRQHTVSIFSEILAASGCHMMEVFLKGNRGPNPCVQDLTRLRRRFGSTRKGQLGQKSTQGLS